MQHNLEVTDKSEDSVFSGEFDAILCCSGYEARARFLPKRLLKYGKSLGLKKYYIPFKDFTDHSERLKNDCFLKKHGYIDFGVDYDTYGSIGKRIEEILAEHEGEFNLLVDYTAMKRTMYAEIIQFLSSHREGGRLNVTFCYSVGISSDEYQPKIISDYVLLPGFEGDTNSQREKFGIYLLGFEPIILQSIHEWIEPSKSLAFYAEPGVRVGSGRRCLRLNKRFLDENYCKSLPQSLFSVQSFCRAFTETVKDVMRERDAIVFSGGPKPFVLGALLSSSPTCQPSHVYARGEEARAVDTTATGRLVICAVART